MGKIENMTERKNPALASLLWALVALLAACQAAAPQLTLTPSPSQAATAAGSPTATTDWFPSTPTVTLNSLTGIPTAEPARPEPGMAAILFEDNFNEGAPWQTGTLSAGNVALGSNALALALYGSKGTIASLSEHNLPSAFYLVMDINVSICSAGDQYGIFFWQNSSAGTYRLWADCDGRLRLERQIYDSIGVIQDWKTARKFEPGAPAKNQLALLASEGELKVYINEVLQFSVPIRSDLSGRLGVMAQSAGEGASTFLFSHLVVYEP